MHGWQANLKRTCASPVLLGFYPKLKYPPFDGGIFIVGGTDGRLNQALAKSFHIGASALIRLATCEGQGRICPRGKTANYPSSYTEHKF